MHTFSFLNLKTTLKASFRTGKFKRLRIEVCTYMYIWDILFSGQKTDLYKNLRFVH